MPQPYKLFTIYAREDAQYLEELRGHLRPLEIAGRLKVWSDREINPGVDWEREIVQNLDTADIILILVSAAYYNSAYIHEKEITHAIGRHERGEAKVLPVIVRPCHFLVDPVISRLQVLPTDGRPVTDRRHWQDRDDAWLDVVTGVKRTLNLLDTAILEKERTIEAQKRAAEKSRQEVETARRREAQAQQARQEQEYLALLRQAQEDAVRRDERVMWQQAHDLPAYENYLARYPQGEYAREARARIRALKRKDASPVPVKRYAAIGGGVFALLLAVWLLSKMFSTEGSEAVTDSHRLTTTDSAQGSKTLPVGSLPENVTVGKPEEKNERISSLLSSPSRKSGLEMVWVPGGTFMMGSPVNESGRLDDECQHEVSVNSFAIGKYEVTQADWREIMGNNPSYHKNCDDCPVEQVSWNDVQEFLKKLNARYPGKNYRLPKEEEWEYAARDGNAGIKTYLSYSGSNSLDAVAWYDDNSGAQTHPVGGKKPNQLGLYDMSGNVWEWCQDIYQPYSCDKKTTASGRYRVNRGGSAFSLAVPCRAAHRNNYEPAVRGRNLGFRLVSVSLQ